MDRLQVAERVLSLSIMAALIVAFSIGLIVARGVDGGTIFGVALIVVVVGASGWVGMRINAYFRTRIRNWHED